MTAHDWLVEVGRFEILVGRSSVATEVALGHDVASTDVVTAVAGPASFVATDDEFATIFGGPIPSVPPVRPFTRNTTLEDLETLRIGRLLSEQATKAGIKRAAVEFPDPDEATLAMSRAAVREGPLRGAVLMTGGSLSFAILDGVLEALNGHWKTALGRFRQRD